MPIADFRTYCEMLDRARTNGFAYPAINVTSLTTANAVLKGLAESKSDGIIQVSTGGAAFASGSSSRTWFSAPSRLPSMCTVVADRYPVYAALHTDHCQADKLDKFVIPLVEETERRRAAGKANLFNSHVRRERAAASGKPRYRREAAGAFKERSHPGDRDRRRGGEEDGMKAEASSSTLPRRTPWR